MPGNEDKPSGGLDKTPLRPSTGTTYTIRITFHSATNLPVADYPIAASDPFILAQINTGLPTRHKEDPRLRFRSETKRRTVEPEWEAKWVVAGIPESGFTLKTRIYDEDPGNHDDRLGKVEIQSGRLSESWKIDREMYEVKKSGADVMAYGLRWGRKLLCRDVQLHATLTMSIEVLGKTDNDIGKAYTVNNFWFMHWSPMIGRLAGTKTNDEQGVERSNFQSNEMQLRGPVPPELYHRYVEFKSFISGMFKGTGIRGRILNKALHHQHERIYVFDKETKHGTFEEPGKDMTLKFLDMVHYDQGGRIFTYVITLDGLFRFTETGKEFGIDLLSKHTMHSDVNIYIAWSGEFLVRRLSKPDKKATAPEQRTHPADDLEGGPPHDDPPKDPRHYELVIDNDSGTYRPDASLLPVLKKFLKSNFPDLHIVVKACDDDSLSKIKEKQRKIKKKEGDHRVYGQGSDTSSISSSDEDDLEERARQADEEEDEVERAPTTAEKVFEGVQNPMKTVKAVSGRSEREAKEEKAGGDGYDADNEKAA